MHAFIALADEAYYLGGNDIARESYLRQELLIEIAKKKSGADAIHPGYGFVSENAEFAKRWRGERALFSSGPKSHVIHALGDKIEAKKLAMKSRCSCLHPARPIRLATSKKPKPSLIKIGYPVLVKKHRRAAAEKA
jgi:acetyl/propionyl-CoA carboxylase alpha subunit